MQAKELLPPANARLENVTDALVENAVAVSQSLAEATMPRVGTRLLPSDLNSTNNVVEQVSITASLAFYACGSVLYEGFECSGEQHWIRNQKYYF